MRKISVLASLCALALLLSGCAGPQKRQYAFYGAFDTVIRLTSYTSDAAAFRALCERAEAEFLRLDAIFDRFEPHKGVNGVWALNHARGEAIAAEPELIELLSPCPGMVRGLRPGECGHGRGDRHLACRAGKRRAAQPGKRSKPPLRTRIFPSWKSSPPPVPCG